MPFDSDGLHIAATSEFNYARLDPRVLIDAVLLVSRPDQSEFVDTVPQLGGQLQQRRLIFRGHLCNARQDLDPAQQVQCS